METIKEFTGRLGEKLFPGLTEKKRQKAIAQIIIGISLALIGMAGMALFHYKDVRQVKKYQKIAAACPLPSAVLGDGKRKCHQEAAEGGRGPVPKTEVEIWTGSIEPYDWDALCRTNEDIRGWLCIPDPLINFPVAGTDDNAFYLSHDFMGDKSSAGCPFMDRGTQVWDFNRVIYGHNMGSGSEAMFSTLLKYGQEEYFRENPIFYFTDVYGSTAAYQVMAVIKYNTEDVDEWDFRTRNHPDMDSYDAWMAGLQGRALYYAEPGHAPEHILTLATCDRREYGKNGRFLVIGAEIY